MEKRKNHFNLFQNIGYVLSGIARYDKAIFGFFALYAVTASLLPFVGVLLPKVLVQGLETGAALQELLLWAGGFMAAGMLLAGMSRYAFQGANMRLVYVRLDMQCELSKKVLEVDFPRIEDPAFLDRVNIALSAFYGNNTGVEGVMHILFDNIPVLLSVIGMGAMLSFLHPLVVLLLVLSGTSSLLLNMYAGRREERMQEELSGQRRRMQYLSQTGQDFAFGKDIRLYGAKEYLLKKFDAAIRARDLIEKKIKGAQLPRVLVESGFTLVREAVVYGYLIYLILNGRMALSDFAMYFAAVASFSQGLQNLLQNVSRLFVENKKVDEVHALLSEKEEDTSDLETPKDGPIGIEFENVSFTYPGGKTVIEDLNLSIQPGEKIAVVGLNGAGKTTLVKLLTRLYKPTKGRILLNGQEAARMRKKDYYRLFSVVFQEIKVYAFTLAENIAMKHSSELDMERVIRAAKLAGIDKKAQSLANGYDSVMLKFMDLHGVELSGGENQRLALARALYKDGPILVLDEPTAALDPLAEQEMYEQFSRMTKGRTSVFISHRLSSTRFCDRILLMEEGRIVEQGSHEELMQRDGKYAQLFNVQAQYYRRGEKKGA